MADLVAVRYAVGIVRRFNVLAGVPISVSGNVRVSAVIGIRIFHGKLAKLLDPFSFSVLVFLVGQGVLHLTVKISRAEGFKHPVPGIQILDFVKFNKIGKGCAALLCLFEVVVVQFQQLDAPSDGGLREAGAVCDALHSIAHVQHHLEALRLLVDGEIRPLHILHHHGLQLLFLGHIDHRAGQFKLASLLRCRRSAVSDDDGVVLAGPHGLGCPCRLCCRNIAAIGNAPGNVLLLAEVVSRNDGQVLVHAVFLDAGCKLGQITQLFARVIRVRMQLPDGDVSNVCHGVYSFLNSGQKNVSCPVRVSLRAAFSGALGSFLIDFCKFSGLVSGFSILGSCSFGFINRFILAICRRIYHTSVEKSGIYQMRFCGPAGSNPRLS